MSSFQLSSETSYTFSSPSVQTKQLPALHRVISAV